MSFETLGVTSRKLNLDFTINKIVNKRAILRRAQETVELFKSIEGQWEEQKGVGREVLKMVGCVLNMSLCLFTWALSLIIAVCPILCFLIKSFLNSLRIHTLSLLCVYAVKTTCQRLAWPACKWRLVPDKGDRHPVLWWQPLQWVQFPTPRHCRWSSACLQTSYLGNADMSVSFALATGVRLLISETVCLVQTAGLGATCLHLP